MTFELWVCVYVYAWKPLHTQFSMRLKQQDDGKRSIRSHSNDDDDGRVEIETF